MRFQVSVRSINTYYDQDAQVNRGSDDLQSQLWFHNLLLQQV